MFLLPQIFKSRRVYVSAAVVVACATGFTLPSSANLADDIDKANADQSADPESLSDFDLASADIDAIAEQMKALNKQVTLSDSKKKKLDAEREALSKQSTDYEADIATLQADIETLEQELAERAVDSFKGRENGSVLVTDTDPTDSLRRNGLSRSANKSKAETAEDLRQAQAELAAKEIAKEDLGDRLELDAQENARNLQKYESARVALLDVADEAEEQAERILSEADGLDDIDKARADELRKSVQELNEQIRIAFGDRVKEEQAKAEANGGTATGEVTPTSDADIRDVGNGIKVHKDIADAVAAMLVDAQNQGIVLRGGGYRSPASQIAVRRNNCGTSNYAIYQMPSSSCRPPTARPGSSMHEQGKAIDFTNGAGATIRVGSPEYVWLSENAARYGLQNFPKESWHWSTNGR